ncbi:unnamed protein product, partial [Rotaria sordida]
NLQLPTDLDLILLTIPYLNQLKLNETISIDEINQYDLKYESSFDTKILNSQDQQSICEKKSKISVNIIQDNIINEQSDVIVICSLSKNLVESVLVAGGDSLRKLFKMKIKEIHKSSIISVATDGDLLREQTDVIVICTSSKSLLDSVLEAGGKTLQQSFKNKFKEHAKDPIFSMSTGGRLLAKAIYFVSWQPNSDPNILSQSIEQLVSNVIEKAASENYKSIAFPAIGCGRYGCSIDLVAQIFVRQVQRQLTKYPIMISFVIHPDGTDIYNEFQKHIGSVHEQEKFSSTKSISTKIGQGTIEVKKGDITKEIVDVIIGSSSSDNLLQVLLEAGGEKVAHAYYEQYQSNPNSLIISTLPGKLSCKKIFFLKWEPNKNPEILRQSIIDLIWNVIQNVNSYNFTSIAFPAIGCGEHACSVDIVVKTMVREMKQQIQNRKLPWKIIFIIRPNEENIYDEFCKQLLASNHESIDYKLPSTWQISKEDKMRFDVSKNSNEYKSIVIDFNKSMKKNYQEIIKIERIQNERWYMQYLAHARDFQKRLNENTEKSLYHGCPEDAASSIIQDCFNRSFAGVNGTAYGVGVYFSSNAAYSHGFTKPNSNGERFMFLACVLIGKTTIGNPSMKTRPVGFDSTTDGKHIYVTYHDAQAYAEYLITYK